MARRERERYTERTRAQPQAAGTGGGGGSSGSSIKNPAVVVAIVGLVMAGVMLLGFLYGGSTPATDTAAGATPTAAADVITPTLGAAATSAAVATPTQPTTYMPNPEGGKYTTAEDQALDPANKAYFATIETAHGPIRLELWPEVAPLHVNSFVFLARQGYFDGLTFHRVEPGFVIQGGDPKGTGEGGPGYMIPGEFNAANPVPHRAGTLAMARTGDPNSAGSQFYVVLDDGPGPSSLDGQYTNFGHVISGMDAVRQVQVGDKMTKVTIEEAPIAERVVSPDDVRAGKLPEGVGPSAPPAGGAAGATPTVDR